MPENTENLNIVNSSGQTIDNHSLTHINNNNMNPVDNGGNGVYTIHALGGAGSNPDHYLSNESLSTNSSGGESTSTLGNVAHRKDHEFIPTRMKQISASKPAADPKQFTRIPSNPLLVSAQKQLMMVEEVKKAKELASQKEKVKSGDDEPDWQNNLSSWKNRRRKQSEEALQRLSEVKALGEEEFGANRSSVIGRKLSTLLYTAPEDDWSDLGIEKTHGKAEDSPVHGGQRSHSRTSMTSPINQEPIPEEESEQEQVKKFEQKMFDIPAKPDSVDHHKIERMKVEPKKIEDRVVEHRDKDERSIIETPPPVAVSVLNKKFSEVALQNATKPLVTYTNQESSVPAVRRKSSELSSTMKSKLEAFIAPTNESREKPEKSLEPDEKFHEKLATFRKISEGKKEDETNLTERKPKLSYSSLIASDFSHSNQRVLQPPIDDEEDNDDSVDKLLDDALEESYRSVLESSESKNSSLQEENDKNLIFKGDDFLNQSVGQKSPPTEKPPPPPPLPAETPKWQQNLSKQNQFLDDDEIDKQEQEIIASLETEERLHKKYMESVHARNVAPQEEKIPPKISSTTLPNVDTQKKASTVSEFVSSSSNRYVTSAKISSSSTSSLLISSSTNKNEMSTSTSTKVMAPSVSQPQLGSQTKLIQQNLSKKKSSEANQQPKPYSGQHWLIQEAEQRRLAGGLKQPSVSPAGSSPASSLSSQPSPAGPVYENVSSKPSTKPNGFSNNQRPESSTSPSGSYPEPSWTQQQYSQENLYANLGSVPPKPSFESSPLNFNRDGSSNPQAKIPGPQVPPRGQGDRLSSQNGGERMLSVSGKKKCSHCKEELGRGAAMIIESLRLFYHLHCFKCCVCNMQLGNGTAGTDVRVRNNKLHCQNCYSNDEGLKFSKV